MLEQALLFLFLQLLRVQCCAQIAWCRCKVSLIPHRKPQIFNPPRQHAPLAVTVRCHAAGRLISSVSATWASSLIKAEQGLWFSHISKVQVRRRTVVLITSTASPTKYLHEKKCPHSAWNPDDAPNSDMLGHPACSSEFADG